MDVWLLLKRVWIWGFLSFGEELFWGIISEQIEHWWSLFTKINQSVPPTWNQAKLNQDKLESKPEFHKLEIFLGKVSTVTKLYSSQNSHFDRQFPIGMCIERAFHSEHLTSQVHWLAVVIMDSSYISTFNHYLPKSFMKVIRIVYNFFIWSANKQRERIYWLVIKSRNFKGLNFSMFFFVKNMFK